MYRLSVDYKYIYSVKKVLTEYKIDHKMDSNSVVFQIHQKTLPLLINSISHKTKGNFELVIEQKSIAHEKLERKKVKVVMPRHVMSHGKFPIPIGNFNALKTYLEYGVLVIPFLEVFLFS